MRFLLHLIIAACLPMKGLAAEVGLPVFEIFNNIPSVKLLLSKRQDQLVLSTCHPSTNVQRVSPENCEGEVSIPWNAFLRLFPRATAHHSNQKLRELFNHGPFTEELSRLKANESFIEGRLERARGNSRDAAVINQALATIRTKIQITETRIGQIKTGASEFNTLLTYFDHSRDQNFYSSKLWDANHFGFLYERTDRHLGKNLVQLILSLLPQKTKSFTSKQLMTPLTFRDSKNKDWKMIVVDRSGDRWGFDSPSDTKNDSLKSQIFTCENVFGEEWRLPSIVEALAAREELKKSEIGKTIQYGHLWTSDVVPTTISIKIDPWRDLKWYQHQQYVGGIQAARICTKN